MAEDAFVKNYELAFHIDPDLEESEANDIFRELSNLIENNSGRVFYSKELRRIRLSYPIRHKQAGYFGVFNFTGSPDIIEKINAKLKLRNDILRYLFVNLPAIKDVRALGERRFRLKAKTQEKIKEIANQPKEKAAESAERLEQEIEKVIEQL